MATWVVLATGESVSQQLADRLRGNHVIVVSDSYKLAPWADALVSQDSRWWNHHQEARGFEGRKFTGAQVDGIEIVPFIGPITSGTNSGLLALHVAVSVFAAKRVLLCGIDLCGTHFFGKHEALSNTTPTRFDHFQQQFSRYKPRGIEILNCSPISKLTVYPKANLEDCLDQSPSFA